MSTTEKLLLALLVAVSLTLVLVDEMFGASWCELTQPDMMPDFDGIDDYEPQAPAPVVQEGDWITFNVPRPR